MAQGGRGKGRATIRQRIGIVLWDTGAGGGTERIARRLGQALARAGREPVRLIANGRGVDEWQAEAAGAAVPVLSSGLPIGRKHPRYFGRWIGKVVLAERLDALIIPGNSHLPLMPSLARALTNWIALSNAVRIPLRDTRVAVMATLSNPLVRRRTPLTQWLFERLTAHRLSAAQIVTAPSPGLLRQAARVVPADRLHLVPIPSLDDAPPLPPPAPEAPPVVLGARRLVVQKNFALLLDALALCPPPVRLILAGDGRERVTLEAHVRRLGVAERVRFIGHVPDIAAPLAEARLLATSSDCESGPAVLMEALAAGRPVVATRCAPSMDHLPASHVDLVPVGDAAALAAAIVHRLARPPEPVPDAILAPHRIDAVAVTVTALLDAVA